MLFASFIYEASSLQIIIKVEPRSLMLKCGSYTIFEIEVVLYHCNLVI